MLFYKQTDYEMYRILFVRKDIIWFDVRRLHLSHGWTIPAVCHLSYADVLSCLRRVQNDNRCVWHFAVKLIDFILLF